MGAISPKGSVLVLDHRDLGFPEATFSSIASGRRALPPDDSRDPQPPAERNKRLSTAAAETCVEIKFCARPLFEQITQSAQSVIQLGPGPFARGGALVAGQ